MLKTNEYFDGKVKSIAFAGNDKAATVGVMAPGDYVFNTSEKEKMSVISGELNVRLTGETRAKRVAAGESFDVPANSTFDVGVTRDTAYLCVYG